MILGGSPHIVAEPPKFAQKISEIIRGTALNFRRVASSIVTAARNKITVIESINIANAKDIAINVINRGRTLYFTSFAISKHNQRKKPEFPIPSTIIIIPARKIIVAQLIPEEDSSPALAPTYQKESLRKSPRARTSRTACASAIQRLKTTRIINKAQVSETHCLSNFSETISKNIATKITVDRITASIFSS